MEVQIVSRVIESFSYLIIGMSKWMIMNKNYAEVIMQVWNDMFEGCIDFESLYYLASYNTKLFLFYIANNIFVQERSSGQFTVLFEFVYDCSTHPY